MSGTAPFGVFTSDGYLEQHFNGHVGTLIAQANDRNGDGVICWIGCPFESGDYTIPDALCPAVGGTGSTGSSSGFQAYCNKGLWETLVASSFFEETRQASTGSKYSNAKGNGTNFTPITIGQLLASSRPLNDGGIAVTVNGITLPSGASYTLTNPATVSLYGLYHGIALDATQPGLKLAASWLAAQWAGQTDGATNVTINLNNNAASITFLAASGGNAARALQYYAGE